MNALNLRIIHTHDTEANWNSLETFVPKAGELIIYDIDDNHSYERFKIGDGVKKITELPFSLHAGIKSMFNIENNIVYADAGRITDYEEKITS